MDIGLMGPHPTKKIQVIDLVRTLSILMVLATHLGMIYHVYPSSHPSKSPILQWIWWKMSVNGRYGVSLFFVISGYLITRLIAVNPRGLFRPDFRDFYSRRVGRIFPLLILIFLLGGAASYFIPDSYPALKTCFKKENVFSYPGFLMSIATFWGNWYLMFKRSFGFHWDVLWSLSVEEQFYFFYPFLLRLLGNEKKLFFFLGIFIFLGPLSMWICWPYSLKSGLVAEHNSFVGFGLIATGSFLYLLSEKYQVVFLKHKKISWCFCVVGFWETLQIYLRQPFRADHWGFVWGNFFLGLGVFLFLLGAINLRTFESKYFTFFSLPGKVSYGMYLLHSSVIFLLWNLFPVINEFLGFFIFSITATCISLLSFYYFEMPTNLFLQKILGQKN